MGIVWNGFAEGETKSSERKARKADKGHSIVRTSTTHNWGGRFTYRVTCECGKRFTGKTWDTPRNTHDRHIRTEAKKGN